ncbi:hypothetical protein LMG33818_000082 [Halomonadaceae bacterium LMG 33818]|uniref:DUF1315 family protein n=1 Tax=Cernens ardua TaxID=3402176 RepID=UPI003EDB86F8
MSEPTSFESLAATISPEIYAAFKKAVEIRKWPDGRSMTPQQLEICLEAMIRYEQVNDIPEAERTGYIDRAGHDDKPANDVETIKWTH